ncbi:translocation/assembly module TamB domain-containing protein [Devosia sp. FJ2-5-3]|uniref:translocation/assembly module TamB domain-containing protein n=1 Tax=Devosia sp. FJ2-5-3 TaxID=2976680 RepID=UPI0023D7BA79|nr:translocation/assembly module TamB domain-containing protein [Devosia sp. FJ2-5-3]WEJ59425.1 translocation/assembly module TamB domain-containing protein [Devosia sp. FJ2-5-3]
MVTLPKISRRFTYVAALLVPVIGVPVALVAQDVLSMPEEQQKDWLTSFVEDRLSTPERQIRLSNIDGILGSDVSVREITISDQQGVWLRVNNASLNWNQGALFTGKLDVRSLRADSIDYIRNAVPAEGVDLPPPEAGSFEIPEFPVAIQLGELAVPRVTFGENVFGLGSEISLAGSLTLEGGNLDTALDITRLDGPGGTLGLDVAYLRADNSIDLSLDLNEPANGVIANLLNIEGRPAMQLTLAGAGPVDDLVAELNLLADGQPALAGKATIEQAADGLSIVADLGGPLSRLVAEPYRPFFGAETRLTANATMRSAGGFDLNAVSLSGGQLSLTASGATTADNFLSRLDLEARIADPSGAPVTLPVAGNTTRVGEARFSIDFGDDDGGNWTAALDIERFETDGFASRQLAFDVAGVASNLSDPANRMVTFNGDGALSGIAAEPAIKAALGDSVGLGLAGMWQGGQPIQLAQLRVVGEALTASLAGVIDGTAFKGRIGLQTDSIAPFSGLAGRQLTGGLLLDAEGEVQAVGGAFDLTFDGTGTNLSVDDETADKLLAGEVALSGRLARNENGIIADDFAITNPQVQFTADGVYASDTADFAIGLDLADLALLSEEASGALRVRGTAKSAAPEDPIALALDADVQSGTLVGRTLRDAQLGLDLDLLAGKISGSVDGVAMLDGYRATLVSQIAVDEVRQALTGMAFEIAGTRISGEVARAVDTELLTGSIDLSAQDISLAAALLLQEASGAVTARIDFAPSDGEQGATVSANAANLRVNDIAIGRADIAATVGDLFGVPAIDGTINAGAISVAGTTINLLDAKASQSGDTTNFEARAALATGTGVAVDGSLSPVTGGYRLGLDHANLVQGQLSARLANPTTLLVEGESVALDAVRFDVGSGRITASGTAGTALDLNVDISALPLSIANAIVPSLGLAGTLEGNARITGSASDPRVSFDARGNGINAAAIAPFGITPLSASTRGTFANNSVAIEALSANGSGGLALTGSGRVPLAGSGLSLSLNGSAPLALANRFLIDRGGQLSGTASFDAQVSGSLANPQFGGSVSTSGAGYVDPELNLRLANIAGRARLDGTTATIETLSANLATGGSASVSGTVGLTGAFPANLTLNVNSARYADGDLFIATVTGSLGLTGNLTGTPLLAGTVLVEQANITVPEGFGGGAQLIDVEHRSAPAAVAQTLSRAKITSNGAPVPQSRSPGMLLDVTLNAPNQIFIRGRGLDAEVGGSVRLTGPLNNIQPVGAFSLNRGRLSILGQRITFERGTVTLVGDLDPQLDFVATTQADDITVVVTVSGRVSALDINFSSNPQLPQDEVLARLIFKRSMGELSPLQLAQLAAAAGELVGAGGGGGGLLGGLRGAAGLADLDVVTDAQGNVGVEAGTYLQDNVYLGVTAGANGQSKVTINLDVTEDLTVKGAAGQDGNSSLGVFYERDY